MGRNEIRLRRQLLSTGKIARHRNYSELMKQHDRDAKMKRIFKVFMYFLIILFITIVLIIVIRWEAKHSSKPTKSQTELQNKGHANP
jgi:hypothetical protein